MTDSKLAFIGLGLIGGSIARGIKRSHPHVTIMAYMRTRSKLEQALSDGVIDVILDGTEDPRLGECDIIFLCTPVEYNAAYLSRLKPVLKPEAFITDVGSTKTDIHRHVTDLQMEPVFVGGHPMAGSEKTGYENSSDHLLENAYYIITPGARSSQRNVNRLVAVAEAIGSIPIVLDYNRHDQITAAISHLPHIVASSLVNLVKDHDDEDGLMKRLAAGGFKDITRIASSSPEMWEQICMTNRENLACILKSYIACLGTALDHLEHKDSRAVYSLFETSRDYRNTFSEKSKGPIDPDYSFTVDIADEVGAISTISVILAAGGISIKNIGINHNREHGEGALRIAFYDQETMEHAWKRLEKYRYELVC
ncbi:MAG: prephenate dehydrogenase [Hungatella sp.]|jgi:prephenate dehydrogenase|nr:prephenate dehydrogenase [Hungatella sp.]